MQVYGPFPLTAATIDIIITRIHPGVAILCNRLGRPQVVTRSNHDIGEVLYQWQGRYDLFYFCYTLTGAQAARLQKRLLDNLHTKTVTVEDLAKIVFLNTHEEALPVEELCEQSYHPCRPRQS
jgi:hypothetical protein